MSTEVGGWSKKGEIMSTWLLNDPSANSFAWTVVTNGPSDSTRKVNLH